MTRRARALGAGLLVVLAYTAAAAWSGHLSPLARRPLLDGLAPPTAYRWVEPPPELAATNEKPTPGTFGANLGPGGSETAVFTTGDAQVSVILPEGSFARAKGQRSVELTVEPIAPSEVAEADDPLRIIGNVYLLEATYRPSGDEAELTGLVTVVLVYPLLANDHGAHSMLWSRGQRWEVLETDDLPSIQQAGADLDALGYVAVAGEPPTPTAEPASGTGSSVATIAIVAAIVVLAVVAAVLMRRRAGARLAGE